MRNFTLFFLFAGFLTVSAQSGHGEKRTDKLHKLFHQNRSELRTTIAELFGSQPDSLITRNRNGQFLWKTIFAFETKKETLIEYEWDSILKIWEYPAKTEYIYDDDDNEIEEWEWELENGIWRSDGKEIRIYDGPGDLTFEYYYEWENNLWVLTDSTKVETVMNTGTPATAASRTFYKDQGQGWKQYLKEEYTYDSAGRELSEISLFWDDVAKAWGVAYRDSQEFGADGKIKTSYEEFWNNTTQTWRPMDDKSIMSYDKGRIATEDEYIVNQETGTWDMSAWVEQGVFYYGGFPAGINEVSSVDAAIWSCGKTIRVESASDLARIQVYDAKGILLYVNNVSGSREFICDFQFHPGVYLVRVETANGQSKTAKVMIR